MTFYVVRPAVYSSVTQQVLLRLPYSGQQYRGYQHYYDVVITRDLYFDPLPLGSFINSDTLTLHATTPSHLYHETRGVPRSCYNRSAGRRVYQRLSAMLSVGGQSDQETKDNSTSYVGHRLCRLPQRNNYCKQTCLQHMHTGLSHRLLWV